MSDVVMPRLSDSMEEGTILRWLRGDGDAVRRGEDLVEIETDKATMVYQADADGPLEIVAPEGATLPIGELIARIGGGVDGARDEGDRDRADGAEQARAAPPRGSAPEPAVAAPPAPPAGNGGERVRASPVARRIAGELGVELSAVEGTGPGGRIVKADVQAAARRAPEPAAAPAAAAGDGTGTAKGETEVVEPTRTQQVIARRMAESRATVPDFTLQAEVDMEAAVQARGELKELRGDQPTPSLNDMVVKACGLALREFPRVNGSYRDGRFELHSRVNVGVAVAAPDALVVPTVFDADRKGLSEIARETRALAERVRDGTVTPPELSGATFTVSNLGMHGISSFTAVINPPQAAILAVGAVEPRPVARDGAVVARHTMSLTLGCDHRILYGADAAQFLGRVRALLEHPAALAL